MTIYYGNDLYLLNKTLLTNIHNNFKNYNFTISNFFIDQENFLAVFKQIFSEINQESLLNAKKVFIVHDNFSLLKNNINFLEEIFNLFKKSDSGYPLFVKVFGEINISSSINLNTNFIFVKEYEEKNFFKWAKAKANNYKLDFENEIFITLIKNLPRQMNIVNNELQKLANLPQPITIKNIENICAKYFFKNLKFLINALIEKKYKIFWEKFHSMMIKEHGNIWLFFSKLVNTIELIRNLKILINKNYSLKQIKNKLKISDLDLKHFASSQLSIEKANELLLKAYFIDKEVKDGFARKNIALLSYFLNF